MSPFSGGLATVAEVATAAEAGGVFTLTWLLTGGGPYYATFTLPQFIYEAAFDRLDFGVASAVLWALYAVTGLLLGLVYAIARQWQVGTSEEEFLL